MKSDFDTYSPGAGRVVLAGGSGFLGRPLAEALVGAGHEVVVLARDPAAWRGPGRAVRWNARHAEESWAAELDGAAALVNLVGKSVECRRTPRNREEILRSRVDSCEALGEALRLVYRPPAVWVQVSSLAIYGDAGERVCDESAFVPGGFPSDVCIAWEEALGRAIRPEMRWVVLRSGLVLGRDGGALPTLARLARLGLGGPIGTGRQWVSWIHLEDMTRLFLEAIRNPAIHGICNASGLQPVTNAEFMATLRRVLKEPFGMPTPTWLVRLGAPLLGTDPDLALNGRRGLPCRIHGLGFRFHHHELEDALADLLLPRPAAAREPGLVETFAR
jgi:uncharacterized protein (TIGR01777 family)